MKKNGLFLIPQAISAIKVTSDGTRFDLELYIDRNDNVIKYPVSKLELDKLIAANPHFIEMIEFNEKVKPKVAKKTKK